MGFFVINMILWSLSGHQINLRKSKQTGAYAAALGGRSSLGFAEICFLKTWLCLDYQGISAQEKQQIDTWYLPGMTLRSQQESKEITMLELRGPELSDQLLLGFQFAQQHWENCQETPQLLTGTS